MTQLLQVDGLAVSYGKLEVVQNLSFAMQPGEVLTIIGPNGAGKTTLLLALTGLLPAHGNIRFQGEVIDEIGVEDRVERGLCLVPERRELFGSMTVLDNLLLGCYPAKIGRRLRRERVGEICEWFPRLNERRHQLATTLSGGERQMLALGRAMMSRPSLLMLDEPSLGLAPLLVREMFRIVEALRRSGVSILLVEQNARAALEVADYGHVMEGGQIGPRRKAETLLADPALMASYLGAA